MLTSRKPDRITSRRPKGVRTLGCANCLHNETSCSHCNNPHNLRKKSPIWSSNSRTSKRYNHVTTCAQTDCIMKRLHLVNMTYSAEPDRKFSLEISLPRSSKRCEDKKTQQPFVFWSDVQRFSALTLSPQNFTKFSQRVIALSLFPKVLERQKGEPPVITGGGVTQWLSEPTEDGLKSSNRRSFQRCEKDKRARQVSVWSNVIQSTSTDPSRALSLCPKVWESHKEEPNAIDQNQAASTRDY